jgi:MFS family permease
MEIAIMSLAAVGFLLQNMRVLLVALFCTGVQSTLFGPVKYSILPSVLKPEELTGGNGLVEMGTSASSILLGMMFGGLIFTVAGEHGRRPAAVAVIIVLAIAGNLLSRMIPRGAGRRARPEDALEPDPGIARHPAPGEASNWRCATRSWA